MHLKSSPAPPTAPDTQSDGSRPHVLLVLVATAHGLDDFLALLQRQAALVGDDLPKHGRDLARHVRRVAADVKVGLLEEQVVDFLGVFLEPVLNVDLLRLFAGEGGDQLEGVAEGGFVSLRCRRGLVRW